LCKHTAELSLWVKKRESYRRCHGAKIYARPGDGDPRRR